MTDGDTPGRPAGRGDRQSPERRRGTGRSDLRAQRRQTGESPSSRYPAPAARACWPSPGRNCSKAASSSAGSLVGSELLDSTVPHAELEVNSVGKGPRGTDPLMGLCLRRQRQRRQTPQQRPAIACPALRQMDALELKCQLTSCPASASAFAASHALRTRLTLGRSVEPHRIHPGRREALTPGRYISGLHRDGRRRLEPCISGDPRFRTRWIGCSRTTTTRDAGRGDLPPPGRDGA